MIFLEYIPRKKYVMFLVFYIESKQSKWLIGFLVMYLLYIQK